MRFFSSFKETTLEQAGCWEILGYMFSYFFHINSYCLQVPEIPWSITHCQTSHHWPVELITRPHWKWFMSYSHCHTVTLWPLELLTWPHSSGLWGTFSCLHPRNFKRTIHTNILGIVFTYGRVFYLWKGVLPFAFLNLVNQCCTVLGFCKIS